MMINQYIKSNKGTSIVEFAIVLPLLLLIFGGIIDFGYMMHQYLVVDDVARATARYASINKDDATAEKLALNGRTNLKDDWKMNFKFVPERPTIDINAPPERGNVTITVSYEIVILSGLSNVILPENRRITRDVVAMTE